MVKFGRYTHMCLNIYIYKKGVFKMYIYKYVYIYIFRKTLCIYIYIEIYLSIHMYPKQPTLTGLTSPSFFK